MPHVAEINVYPIKSCGRIPRQSAAVRERGLEGDRRYMLVDAEGRFLTQRRYTQLALVQVDDDANGYRIDAPDRPTLRLPRESAGGAELKVKIWRDTVDATAVGGEADEWFSSYLSQPVRVVYMAEHQHRAVPNEAAAFDDEVGFADAAPLLLTSTASLAALNERLAAPVTMRRFRPSVVVGGFEPFAEDSWRLIRIGEAELEIAWPCSRCIVTTIDPETGVPDPGGQPLRTLRDFRKTPAGVMFGQNVIPRRLGTIRVGDDVEVMAFR